MLLVVFSRETESRLPMQVRPHFRIACAAVRLVAWLVVGAAAGPQAPEHCWSGSGIDHPIVRETTSSTFGAWTAEDRVHTRFLPLGANRRCGGVPVRRAG